MPADSKWLKKWQKAKLHKTPEISADEKAEKFYCLDMFPYPSGAGLHVGHAEGYAATDILCRYMRMRGKKVLHPIGWDAFGLPAENYAIKTKVHPDKTTDTAIKVFTAQINNLGLSYDWEREIQTSKPEYYKWTQWFFLLLYNNGLAYKKKAKVNWCESCQTVLANEQAEGGQCERCHHPVIQKELSQWFFKITDFIEDQEYEGRKVKGLLSGLDDVDWPESTKSAQKNWIGKSVGAEVIFNICVTGPGVSTRGGENVPANSPGVSTLGKEAPETIKIFTTRPDTLFGAMFMVICPEHALIEKFKADITNLAEVEKYIAEAKGKTDLQRTDLNKEKSGVEVKGIFAINPVNNKKIPIFVADYVLSTYGTGAIMAVPGHDERDFAFAKKYKLPIVEVVKPPVLAVMPRNATEVAAGAPTEVGLQSDCWCGDGVAVSSDFLNGLTTEKATAVIVDWLEKNNCGRGATNYRIRDWLVSRQRFWGAPIPIIYCEKCGEGAVPEKDLPVELPTDVDFLPTGESPLARSKTFHKVKCPKCGAAARRESDTMDTFVCSSWYFYRYLDPKNKKAFASKEEIEKWLPVDVYLGGAEHTVLHLLYARFFTKVLQKYGYVDFSEPFTKLRHQGIIVAEDGNKMSKSRGNVVNPDEYVEKYGADTLRLYEMFLGALEDMKPWNTQGVIGVYRFIEKVKSLAEKIDADLFIGEAHREALKELHKTIKKVGSDIENMKFNTAISQMMILSNALNKLKKIPKEIFEKFLLVLAPFAPFTAEELWDKLGNKFSIHQQRWPQFDEALALADEINIAVQFSGKTRGTVAVAPGSEQAVVVAKVKADEKLVKYFVGDAKKIIFVKDRIVNFIV